MTSKKNENRAKASSSKGVLHAPAFRDLPVGSVHYDHSTGTIRVFFRIDSFTEKETLTLISPDGSVHNAKTRRLSAREKIPERIVAVFKQARVQSLSRPWTLITSNPAQAAPALFIYIPEQHRVRNWCEDPANRGELTTLLSFPRSGSNFLQNVIRNNSAQVGCVSIYQTGQKMYDPKLCLKSHALDSTTLKTELTEIWGITARPRRHIVLLRDPRDVFISLYDYVAGQRKTTVDPQSFLTTDFYWYLFRPPILELIRDGTHAQAKTVLQAYREWYQSWVIDPSMATEILYLRYEDLVTNPTAAFTRVFGWLSEPTVTTWKGLETLVSQNGESQRKRGKARGWRQASPLYQPILSQIESELKTEIAELGYA